MPLNLGKSPLRLRGGSRLLAIPKPFPFSKSKWLVVGRIEEAINGEKLPSPSVHDTRALGQSVQQHKDSTRIHTELAGLATRASTIIWSIGTTPMLDPSVSVGTALVLTHFLYPATQTWHIDLSGLRLVKRTARRDDQDHHSLPPQDISCSYGLFYGLQAMLGWVQDTRREWHRLKTHHF